MTLADLKPYPGYKDSGVEWLGEVPAHWDVERLKRCMANIIEQTNVRNDNELYVGLEHVESWTGRLTEVDEDIEFDSQVKSFEAGDILFGKLRPYLAKVTRPTRNGVCVGEFLVLRPRDKRIVGACIERSLRAKPMIDAVDSSTFGAKMPRADWQFVGAMPIAVPPVTEQIAIVRFLDHADRRIRRYIRAKEKLIVLLEEQKQAVIHEAVTGRIDVRTGRPYPNYKPSGVEWLGEVPAHWSVKRLRQCGTAIGGMTPSMGERRFWDGDIPWVTPKDMKCEAIRDSGIQITRAALRETSIRLIGPPAVLMVVRGMILARKVPIARIMDCVTINQDMKALVPAVGIRAEFLACALDSAQDALATLIDEAGHGTRRLPTERLRTLALAIPSDDEQSLVVRFVDHTTAKIDKRIADAHREGELLREYRTRLIADVVTGKLDVREAAAALPDEPDDPDAAEADCGEPEGGDDGQLDRCRRPAVLETQQEMTP